MGECKIDHTLEDVKKKFEEQAPFLKEDLKLIFQHFFVSEQNQTTLNEVFHLLKKYDLASEEEREERNNQLLHILNESKE